MTDNHSYETPSQGTADWHVPLNDNFERLDTDVEIRDVAANRGDYEPKEGAKFLELDTGIVYVGDGTEWEATLAMAYYDESGDVACGELAECVEGESNGTGDVSAETPSTFGRSARSVHEGAIVFGDSTTRSIWSRRANEIRSQMPIHAPAFASTDVGMAGSDLVAGGRVQANSVSASSSLSGSSLDVAGLSVGMDELTVEIDTDYPQLAIAEGEVEFYIDSEEPALRIEADGIFASKPIYGEVQSTSARAAKTGVRPVDPEDVLTDVASLEVATWEYRDGDTGQHMGPMAEDFAATFGLGDDDDSIATVDADGVALAAIQGLVRRLEASEERLRERLTARDEKIDDLETENEALRERVRRLEESVADGAIDLQ